MIKDSKDIKTLLEANCNIGVFIPNADTNAADRILSNISQKIVELNLGLAEVGSTATPEEVKALEQERERLRGHIDNLNEALKISREKHLTLEEDAAKFRITESELLAEIAQLKTQGPRLRAVPQETTQPDQEKIEEIAGHVVPEVS